jgi:hypothetical protein
MKPKTKIYQYLKGEIKRINLVIEILEKEREKFRDMIDEILSEERK